MKIRKLIVFFFIIAISVAGYISWQLFGPTINAPQEKYFYIKTGSSYDAVKANLVQLKILNREKIFDRVAKYLHYDKTVKPGKYKVIDGMSLVNLIRMLRSGRQSPVNLVITKIRTVQDLAKKNCG